MRLSKNISIVALLIITVLPAIAAHIYPFPKNFISKYYWGEAGLILLFSLKYYHKQLLIFSCIAALSAFILSQNDYRLFGDLRVSGMFWLLYSGCWIIYFDINKSRLGQWIRLLHPINHLLYYLVFMSLAIVVSFSATTTFFNGWDYVPHIPMKTYIFFVSVASITPTLTITALKIIDMIGANHVLYFLLGTYKRPVEKTEIVLFLDMVGSSTISEKLSPKNSMAFITQFIFDASYVFRVYGGDIQQYTGDGLVVTWPIHKAKNVLQSFQALENRLKKNQNLYKKKFNTVPDFRIGAHAGRAVISQIGEEKLFLGIYGNVVNIAARLEQMNKSLGTKFLVSEHVLRLLGSYAEFPIISMGIQKIPGQTKEVEVFTLQDETKAKKQKQTKTGSQKTPVKRKAR